MSITPISKKEARKIISELGRVDLDSADFDYLVGRIKRLIHGVPFRFALMPPGAIVYRCIAYPECPQHLSKLGAPPAHLAKNYQRCNAPQAPMFYCAEDPGIAIHEIRPSIGTEIYVSRWRATRTFSIGRLTLPPDEFYEDLSKLVYTFFELKLTQPISQSSSEKYKITAAISKCMSTGGAPPDEPELGGILYSSVARSHRGRNLAIWPHIAMSSLELLDVERILITHVLEKDFVFSRIDYASTFVDGEIHWGGSALSPERSTWGTLVEIGIDNRQKIRVAF